MLMRSSNTRSISQNQSPSGVRSRGSVTPRRGRTKGGGGALELAPIASLRMSMSASAISVQRLYGSAKSVAPRFEIPELVERGTSGGEQHHIARPGGLRGMPHGGNEQFTVVDRHQRAQNFSKTRPRPPTGVGSGDHAQIRAPDTQ